MYKSETTQRYICIIGVLIAVFFILTDACIADRGGWHMSTEPVTLTESGQRAIIGWDGQTEVLCLATDVSASKETKVIEFLPLPSEPNVVLGDRQAFETVEKVLDEHYVRFFKRRSGLSKGLRAGGDGGEPFRITFHQRLGAHDVTVVKVNRPEEFADWVQEKARALTGGRVSLPDSIRKLIAKYLNEYNCSYFVFDVIEVGPDPQSVEPIIYEFKCPVVFYPLEISSTFHGRTTIDLIVFSKDRIDPDPFWRLGFQVSSLGSVPAPDIKRVMPRLEELLGERACLQAFRYAGKIRKLKGNITVGLRRDNLSYTPDEYSRAESRSFYQGLIFGTIGGVIIAFVALCPMYFAAKRQKPRWALRLLAGLLLGMPLALGLIFGGAYILHKLMMLEYFSHMHSPVIFIICSMGVGFIIFCSQLGLRRRWYLWLLVYAALAIPVTFITSPDGFEKVFELFHTEHWHDVPTELKIILAGHILVFMLLFFIGIAAISVSNLSKKDHSSLSRWGSRSLVGFLVGVPLGLGLILGAAYVLGKIYGWRYLSRLSYPLIPLVCSMGTGFIIFCFRLGLRRRWYLGWLIYVALAIFVTLISVPRAVEDIFDGTWGRSWERIGSLLIAYLLIFVLLFLIARFIIWITGQRKSIRGSLSR
jgi:hypothetical protein